MDYTYVIKRPVLTEKSTRASSDIGSYAFVVDRKATKNDIKDAVEKLFKKLESGDLGVVQHRVAVDVDAGTSQEVADRVAEVGHGELRRCLHAEHPPTKVLRRS